MKNKSISWGIILIFLISSMFPIISGGSISSNNIIYVDDDGDADYTRIQDAIDNASDGDTVFVYNGTYYENVVVNKTVDLTGEDRNSTIIEGRLYEYIINISADWVNLSGFTILSDWEDEPFRGVYLESNHTTITDNIIKIDETFIGL